MGDHARDTVARVKDDTRRTARRVQRHDGLDADVHRGRVERLEYDLHHLAVPFGHIGVPPDRTTFLPIPSGCRRRTS